MRDYKSILYWAVIVSILSLAGCASSKPVIQPTEPVIEYRDRVEYCDRVDSVYVRDSVVIKEKAQGDTIYYTEIRYKDRYVYKERTDTLAVHDSIPVPYPVIQEVVTNELNWWQRLFVRLGEISSLIVLVILFIRFVRI